MQTQETIKQDISPFLQGGLPGIARLKQVLTSIMAYHRLEHGMEEGVVQTQMEALLQQAGYRTYMDSNNNLSFHIPDALLDGNNDGLSSIKVE
jgi:hypothetical protein